MNSMRAALSTFFDRAAPSDTVQRISLASVEELSSDHVVALVRLHSRLVTRRGRLVLTDVRPSVRRRLGALGLSAVVEVASAARGPQRAAPLRLPALAST